MELARSNHVNLTVSRLDRSVAWYCEVFELVVVGDEQRCAPATDVPLRYRALFHRATTSYVVGLIEHPDGEGSTFDERRTGLDHFALHVPERADLRDWAHHLDRLEVEHSGIKQAPYEDAITLRDPDNIQLEICWPNVAFWTALQSD